jgi:RNA polymerase sigma factor (sigma-70 family)
MNYISTIEPDASAPGWLFDSQRAPPMHWSCPHGRRALKIKCIPDGRWYTKRRAHEPRCREVISRKSPAGELRNGISAYQHEARQLQLLSPADEIALAKRIKANGEDGRRAMEEMIRANLRLVVAVANKRQTPLLSLPDLIQAGNLGLMKAAEKFDWRLGNRFSTHATWWIKKAIQQSIEREGKHKFIDDGADPEQYKYAKEDMASRKQGSTVSLEEQFDHARFEDSEIRSNILGHHEVVGWMLRFKGDDYRDGKWGEDYRDVPVGVPLMWTRDGLPLPFDQSSEERSVKAAKCRVNPKIFDHEGDEGEITTPGEDSAPLDGSDLVAEAAKRQKTLFDRSAFGYADDYDRVLAEGIAKKLANRRWLIAVCAGKPATRFPEGANTKWGRQAFAEGLKSRPSMASVLEFMQRRTGPDVSGRELAHEYLAWHPDHRCRLSTAIPWIKTAIHYGSAKAFGTREDYEKWVQGKVAGRVFEVRPLFDPRFD